VAIFEIAGRTLELEASSLPKSPTRDLGAWLQGAYVTLKLSSELIAVRTHTGGKSFPDRPGSNIQGAWYAFDDIIQTSGEYVHSRSLPGPFTQVAWVRLPTDTAVNIGFCGPLFGSHGGGAQAEHVGGPNAEFSPVDNVWHSVGGSA
jgi:hypothetical protein